MRRRAFKGYASAAGAAATAFARAPCVDADCPRRPALFFAARGWAARLLLSHGAEPAARDKYARTALHVACEKQRGDVAAALLEWAPALLSLRDAAGNCALHEAAEPALVALLCAAGADLDAPDARGDTPLHVAARSGRDALVECLLARGADAARPNAEGRTPLHHACERGHRRIVQMLLDAQSGAQAAEAGSSAPTDASAASGSAAAAVAADSAAAAAVSAAINRPDDSGWTSLHLACLGSAPEHESHTPLVALLLSRGAAVSARDVSGLQALHVCTDTSALRLLLAGGADPLARDDDARLPLHYQTADSSVVLLEAAGSEAEHVDARDRYERTPLLVCGQVLAVPHSTCLD